jgi:hypothetical protein
MHRKWCKFQADAARVSRSSDVHAWGGLRKSFDLRSLSNEALLHYSRHIMAKIACKSHLCMNSLWENENSAVTITIDIIWSSSCTVYYPIEYLRGYNLFGLVFFSGYQSAKPPDGYRWLIFAALWKTSALVDAVQHFPILIKWGALISDSMDADTQNPQHASKGAVSLDNEGKHMLEIIDQISSNCRSTFPHYHKMRCIISCHETSIYIIYCRSFNDLNKDNIIINFRLHGCRYTETTAC